MNINDENSKYFCEKFLGEYLSHGFQSLNKKDLDLLIFHLLFDTNMIDEKNVYESALELKITPNKIKTLQLESYLRWNNPSKHKLLKKMLRRSLTEENLSAISIQEKKYIEQNKMPLIIENAAEKFEFIQAVKDLGSLPEYTLNNEVIIIYVKTFYQLVKKYAFVGDENQIKCREFVNTHQNISEFFPASLGEEAYTFGNLEKLMKHLWDATKSNTIEICSKVNLLGVLKLLISPTK